jgi:hypothetical protein
LVVHAGERAVARARRQTRASQLSLSASANVVIVAAAASARYRGQQKHPNPQSLVQSHRIAPSPTRLEALPISLVAAQSNSAGANSVSPRPCGEITEESRVFQWDFTPDARHLHA